MDSVHKVLDRCVAEQNFLCNATKANCNLKWQKKGKDAVSKHSLLQSSFGSDNSSHQQKTFKSKKFLSRHKRTTSRILCSELGWPLLLVGVAWLVVYTSSPQPKGRGPVAARGSFGTGLRRKTKNQLRNDWIKSTMRVRKMEEETGMLNSQVDTTPCED